MMIFHIPTLQFLCSRNLWRPKLPHRTGQFLPLMGFCLLMSLPAYAQPDTQADEIAIPNDLAPHKALYDIELVNTRSGAQVTNVQGKMLYEWQKDCDGWVSTHKFDLYYDYADSPPMRIASSFSTYEDYDGKTMTYMSERKRNGHTFKKLRGEARLQDDLSGTAKYTMPQELKHELPEGTFFPMGHTLAVFKALSKKQPFFTATVFDGSDDEGPVQINAFLGKRKPAIKILKPIKKHKTVDAALLPDNPHHVRLSFFPKQTEEMSAEYEMDMLLHDNGVISDMIVDYDKFSIHQRLIALEPTKNLCDE